MKVSEMINNLQAFMRTYGDLDCWYAADDEGNAYREVYYMPSCYYVNKYGEMYLDIDLVNEDPEDAATLKQVCIVN